MFKGDIMRYPLGNYTDVTSKTGKRLSEINLEAVSRGEITSDDIKISKDTLLLQGQVARDNGRTHLGQNFERASELVDIPDELLMEIYGKLRPYRATKSELNSIADMLQKKYGAKQCAKLVLDAAATYEKRGILK